MGSLQREAACHDHADIAGSEDDDFAGRHAVIEINVGLGHTGCKYACRPLAGNGQCAARSFPASHCQDDSLCFIPDHAIRRCDRHDAGWGDGQHSGICDERYSHAHNVVNIFPGIFRTAQGHAELCQAESVVDTLTQYASEVLFPLHDQDIMNSVVP